MVISFHSSLRKRATAVALLLWPRLGCIVATDAVTALCPSPGQMHEMLLPSQVSSCLFEPTFI